MKKSILFVVLCAFSALQLSAQFKLNPKVGINLNHLSNDPADLETNARVGFSVGADARMAGKRFYFQPGLHYNVMSYDLTNLDNDSPEFTNDITAIKSIRVPLNVGMNLINWKLFKIRAFGGVTGYQVTGVSDNTIGLTKDDFSKNYWGANIGFGVDLLFLTLDLTFERGQSAVFKNQADTKNQMVALSAGIRF
jgi:Outer membrane protein beta-barrel domain